MKICLVAVNFWKHRGEARVNYEIAQEAIRRGHQVTLVARNVAPELLNSQGVSWIQIPRQKFSIQILSYSEFCCRVSWWLARHRKDYDLVHVSEARSWIGADIFTSHFLFHTWAKSPFHPWQIAKTPSSFYQKIVAVWFSFWQQKLFPTTPLVAVSETLRQELIAQGIEAEKIAVINNGVELEEFYPSHTQRRGLGLPENVPLALFAGDIKLPRKNLDTLLKALKHLPQVHLAVAGKLERSPYPQLAQKLGIENRVHFLGFRSDLPQIMRAVDLFVVPSRYDTFGLVVLEAMASGLPVITTEKMGVAALVTPESGIVLSNTEDIDSLVEAIARIVGNPQLQESMGQAGIAIAQNHSWQNTSREYLDLFERQYQQKQPSPPVELLKVS